MLGFRHKFNQFNYTGAQIESLAQNYSMCILHIFQEKQNISYIYTFLSVCDNALYILKTYTFTNRKCPGVLSLSYRRQIGLYVTINSIFKFFTLIFGDNFFIINFSKLCSR